MRIIAVFLIISFSCNNGKPVTNNNFDTKTYFENEIKQLLTQDFGLLKTLTYNNNKDETNLSNPDWYKELAPFLEIDLTKPAYTGRFNIEKNNNSLIYTAKDKTTDIKKVTLNFNENGEVHAIEILISEINNLYNSHKRLFYQSKIIFEIEGMQKVKLLEEAKYQVKGLIVNNRKSILP
ncbi:MAG: hypothetical protein ACK4K9_08320 [Bacteroidia bacterium]